jgi:hypothetical protein
MECYTLPSMPCTTPAAHRCCIKHRRAVMATASALGLLRHTWLRACQAAAAHCSLDWPLGSPVVATPQLCGCMTHGDAMHGMNMRRLPSEVSRAKGCWAATAPAPFAGSRHPLQSQHCNTQLLSCLQQLRGAAATGIRNHTLRSLTRFAH